MRKPSPIRHRRKPSEEGYILVVVIFMLAILMIALTVAAPIIKKDIQRDREIETMHRGKQYARAIKLYYKRFGAYPPSVDALVKTNEIRFLRKSYIDPTTGKDVWKIIHLGQNKVPTAWGFFGVPFGGAGIGGSGLCGNALPGSTSTPTSPGGSSMSPSSSSPSSFGSSSTGTSNFGSSSTGTSGCPTDTSSTTTSTDPNAANGATGPNAANGVTNQNATSGATDPNAANGSSATGTGLTGQTFGGGGIIGISPGSPKQSILVYHKKNHYNEWEFVYDPLADQMMMQGGNAGTIGQPVSGTTSLVGSPTFGGNSSSSFGSTPGGTNPGGTTAPTTPQPTPPQ
jgi:type II secretory pathway pseudopilin PulG